jgi:uncharacterized protein YbdZ (MbtH family)
MQSVPITTNVVSSNAAHGEMYSHWSTIPPISLKQTITSHWSTIPPISLKQTITSHWSTIPPISLKQTITSHWSTIPFNDIGGIVDQ